MLLYPDQSALLVIDLQERLVPALHAGSAAVTHTRWLMEVAERLRIPTRVTEQNPRGLGHTVTELQPLIPRGGLFEKIFFNATFEEDLRPRLLSLGRRQWVLAGAEAHVCVLQTAFGLMDLGHQVFVVEEAVDSRQPRDRALALERLRAAGASIVSREMVAFEWLRRAGTDVFRSINRDYIRDAKPAAAPTMASAPLEQRARELRAI